MAKNEFLVPKGYQAPTSITAVDGKQPQGNAKNPSINWQRQTLDEDGAPHSNIAPSGSGIPSFFGVTEGSRIFRGVLQDGQWVPGRDVTQMGQWSPTGYVIRERISSATVYVISNPNGYIYSVTANPMSANTDGYIFINAEERLFQKRPWFCFVEVVTSSLVYASPLAAIQANTTIATLDGVRMEQVTPRQGGFGAITNASSKRFISFVSPGNHRLVANISTFGGPVTVDYRDIAFDFVSTPGERVNIDVNSQARTISIRSREMIQDTNTLAAVR